MPTIFLHTIFAVVTAKAGLKKSDSYWFWFLIAGCAVIPNADVVSYSFGVERGGMFAHRGFTHSIVFAVLFGAFIAFPLTNFCKPEYLLQNSLSFFSLAVFSHPLLDMLTDGGPGIALLAPFSNERFFFPWRPVEVSPIGLRFFSDRGLTVIFSEIIWIWLPAFGILTFGKIIRNIRKKTS